MKGSRAQGVTLMMARASQELRRGCESAVHLLSELL